MPLSCSGGGETLFDYRPYRARFEERARQLGVDPVILGTLDNQEVAPLVAASRCLGFVSVNEGFGLAAMEALAAGVPVVARDIPVVRDVFGDSVSYASDVSEIGRALADAIDGKTTLQQIESGRRLANAHTWDATARLHEEFYATVAPRPTAVGE